MFQIDERIQSTCFTLGDWPLSRVLLKNERVYPWLILVPRKDNIQELFQLKKEERYQLMEEINQLSDLMNDYFKPSKLNVGALGNVVSQLHVHVIARYQKDPLWPQGIWQSSMIASSYEEEELSTLLTILRERVEQLNPVLR